MLTKLSPASAKNLSSRVPRARFPILRGAFLAGLNMIGLLLSWAAAVRFFGIPAYILPSPYSVARSLEALPGYYARNMLFTLAESAAGAGIGFVGGVLFGMLLRYGGRAGQILQPLVIASQVFPKEALAPIFLIIFGFGMLPKIVISALICFFPVAISAHRGLQAAPDASERLLFVLGATRWQLFTRCQLPFAAPQLLSAARVCTTLSVVGAIVGEFVGSDRGLGHVIRSANSEVATERIYAALLLLGVIGGAFYGAVVLIERIFFFRYVPHTASQAEG